MWCICLIVMELVGVIFANTGAHTQFDFRSFYTAGYLARTHPAQLYNLAAQEQIELTRISPAGFLPFYHPAYEAFLYTAFSILSYRAAYLAFIGFNLLLVMVAFFAARSAFSSAIFWRQPRPGLMLFLFLPLLIAVAHGQDSIVFLVLLCLAWRQLEKGKDISAGCVLGLALFKFQIAIPIALLVAIRRGWRFSAGFLAVSAAVVLLCIGIVGLAGTTDYVHLMFGAVSAIDKRAAVQHGMDVYPSAMTNLAGLLYGFGARFLPSFAFNLLVGVCSLGLFVWSALSVRRFEQEVAFSIAILCGLLVSYHLFIYDLTLALLPVVLLARRTPRFILIALFGLPLILLPFGAKWFFPAALPVLAMLLNALVSSSGHAAPAPQATHAV
jgi:hypothetical protein